MNLENNIKRDLDEIYVNLLFRKADMEAIQYFTPLLMSGQITFEKIKNNIKDSQEYKAFFYHAPLLDEFTKTYGWNEPGQNPSKMAYFGKTYWMGVRTFKFPQDLWVYQELIFEIKPDFIIETGTYYGGSALFMAAMCDLVNHGTVITIDPKPRDPPVHNRIKYLTGSSTDVRIFEQVKEIIKKPSQKVMVVLDSLHQMDHVFQEMEIFSKLVSKNSYMIVEDTIVNGNPVWPEHGPGPMEAIKKFLSTHEEFVVDTTREKFLLTLNRNGYLKKVREED